MPQIPASHRDLLDGQVATLATVGPDGRPQVSEVWFLAEGDAEGDTVAISLNTSRQKTKNLRANPAATVFLLDLAVRRAPRLQRRIAADPSCSAASSARSKACAGFVVPRR